MELSSELSILISSMKYAELKVGKSLFLVEGDECQKIVEQLEQEVVDIITGLNSDHCDVEKSWWNSKLHNIFLFKALERYRHVQSCEIQDSDEPNSVEVKRSSWPNPNIQKEMNASKADGRNYDNSNYVQNNIYKEIPFISVDIYLTAIVKFKWFCFFEESGCYLDIKDIMILSHNILDYIKECSSNSISLISPLLGMLLSYKLTNTKDVGEKSLNCMDKLSELIEECLNYVSTKSETLADLSSTCYKELVARLLLIPFIESPCNVINRNVNHSARKIFHMLNFVRTMGKNEMIESSDDVNLPVSNKSLYMPWLICCKTLFNIFDNLQFDLLTSPTLHFLDLQICTESVLGKLLSLKTMTLLDGSSSEYKGVETVFDVIEQYYKKHKDISDNLQTQIEVENSFENFLNKIEEKVKGFEDDIEHILYNSDPCTWLNNRLLDVLTKQPAVLYKEDYIYKLSEIYHVLQSQPKLKQELSLKFIMLIFEVYKSLPVLLQEKFILHIYERFGSSHQLTRYDLDLTSTLNRFTSQSTSQISVDIACFLLSDVTSTIRALLDTVISNAAQIDTVIKIFHLFPRLCWYHHPIEHPNLSLLVSLLQQVILTSEFTALQEKNLLKFISVATQDYDFTVHTDYTIRERASINAKELLQFCIEYLSMDNVYLSVSTMNLELTMKLITTVIDKSMKKGKRCNWLYEYNNVAILSVLGHLYNECVDASNLEYGRRFHVRQIINKLLAAWKTALKVTNFSVQAFDISWLMMEVEKCCWPTKIVLHKYLAEFVPDGRLLHQRAIEKALDAIFELIDQDYKPLIQFSIVNEECLSLIKDKLHQDGSYSPLQVSILKASLIQVLPNLVSSEWTRLNHLISTLIQRNILIEHIRMPFLDKIQCSLLSEVWHSISGVQILTDVILNMVLSPSSCTDELIHISKCYSTLLSTIVSQMNNQENPSGELICLTIIQLASFLCVIMAMSCEVQDILFVCLLDLLENLKACYRSGEKIEAYQINSIITATSVIPDNSMRNTIKQKIENIIKLNGSLFHTD